jgi:hypothetical protein
MTLGSRLRCFFGMRASQRTLAELHLALICQGLEGNGVLDRSDSGAWDQPFGYLREAEALELIRDCDRIGEKNKNVAQE